jgi:serine/threonine protein kinase
MLPVHQRLGDFEIIRLLGKGGMGEVYEAQQFHPPRPVALKVLAPWLAEDGEALQRFWREAAVPARLDHPNIVRIISTGQSDGIAFYTMQLVRGISLARLIELANAGPPPCTAPERTVANGLSSQETPGRGEPAPPPLPADEGAPPVLSGYLRDRYGTVARLGAQAARALAHAHRQGVLHRDIKPSNLMVDQHDHLYVVDFGLTRALAPDAMGTRAGAVRGTPWYMSPEQARGETVDERSDIYSLGVTLYELATQGLGPFTVSRQNAEAVMGQVKAGQWLPLRVLIPDVPPALEKVIHRALHFKPGRRLASAEELAAELESLPRGPGAVTRTARPFFPRGKEIAGLLRNRPFQVVLGLCVTLALAVLLVSALPRGPRSGGTGGEQAAAGPPQARPWRQRIPLLREDPLEPVWYERLAGDGRFFSQKREMMLFSGGGSYTLLALDNDPQRRWFEFAVRLSQLPDPRSEKVNQLGLFFGYRRNSQDPSKKSPFFVLQLDERKSPDHPDGRLLAGSANPIEAEGARGANDEWLRALPGVPPVTPLPARPLQQWRQLRVRALDGRVTVTADSSVKPLLSFSTEEMRAANAVEAEGLDPRGALGLWVREGAGYVQEATIMALPSDRAAPE